MEALLQGYEVNRPTWFYLSSLLIIAVYFRFTRIISLRNVDLLLLLSASPGLIFVGSDIPATQSVGHLWLFLVACLFLVRLFIDPFLNRRPYLGQNLNPQGLGFFCVAAFAFLMTQAVTESLPDATQETVQRADDLLSGTATVARTDGSQVPGAGPAASLISSPAVLLFEHIAARILAILAHAAVVSGLWFVGRNLFADRNLGLAMATLYLLLPCTAYNVGEFNHVLPAALIVWAFVCFRKPVVSGVLLGLACGTMLFPVFLLPIWSAFYGRRNAGRFVAALCGVAIVLLACLAITSADSDSFVQRTIGENNVILSALSGKSNTSGFWKDLDYLSVYRLPVMVAYFIMLTVMTIWPKSRTVEVLLAQSTAAVVGTQLWYEQQGGVYLLWYLPLMLMVVFRPRLMHLRAPGHVEQLLEQTNVSTGKPQPATVSGRSMSSRTLHLFR
ncbi:glycosyltransferase family 87 protein [Planctomicrobium sp. SH661]|uniref:glycosyltransferase family 87 protein n=1 Tax=Planctomicrobium sp. SH661 TaxID=3448124 RepID=UPI003F5B5FCF